MTAPLFTMPREGMICRWLVVEVHAVDEAAVEQVAQRIDKAFQGIHALAPYVTVLSVNQPRPDAA